jgi:hypothetical protein
MGPRPDLQDLKPFAHEQIAPRKRAKGLVFSFFE